MRRRAFDVTYSTIYAILWVNLYQQMHMVWHDFHLDDIDVAFFADSLYQLFQTHINSIDQDLTAIFWAPNHMVLAGVHHIFVAFVFHADIISQMQI